MKTTITNYADYPTVTLATTNDASGNPRRALLVYDEATDLYKEVGRAYEVGYMGTDDYVKNGTKLYKYVAKFATFKQIYTELTKEKY